LTNTQVVLIVLYTVWFSSTVVYMDHYSNLIISLVPLYISICTEYQVFSFINHAPLVD